jgi:hypothetical protein
VIPPSDESILTLIFSPMLLLLAPAGWMIKAQGIALRRNYPISSTPEGARLNLDHLVMFSSALSGLMSILCIIPSALPWAVFISPFRASS